VLVFFFFFVFVFFGFWGVFFLFSLTSFFSLSLAVPFKGVLFLFYFFCFSLYFSSLFFFLLGLVCERAQDSVERTITAAVPLTAPVSPALLDIHCSLLCVPFQSLGGRLFPCSLSLDEVAQKIFAAEMAFATPNMWLLRGFLPAEFPR